MCSHTVTRALAGVGAVALLLPACRHPEEIKTPPGPAEPQSVLLVLMDDLWLDGARSMPSVEARKADAVVFERAYVDTPLCCPTRTSLLAGGFLSQHTGVLANSAPNGGATRFVDTMSLPVQLQVAGYRTGLVGKYLNEVEDLGDYVPPGWDTYQAFKLGDDYESFTVVTGSSTPDAPAVATSVTADQYVTEYTTASALTFLEDAGSDPFFLYLPFNAPHFPSIPADQDVGTQAGAARHQGAYDEEDVSDKPAHVQEAPRIDETTAATYDTAYATALESLQGADRAIEEVFQALEASGRIDDTLVVFASDNGFLWGEHRLFHKGWPYEESVHVPLYLWPPGGEAETRDDLVSVSLDLPATIHRATGVNGPTVGIDLLPVHDGPPRRDLLLLEATDLLDSPTYTGVVTAEWKYIEYVSGESELYDLAADPYEERNLSGDSAYQDIRADLAPTVAQNRLLTVVPKRVRVTLGEENAVTLEQSGGVAPVTFELVSGSLPPGVALTSGGALEGTPSEMGEYVVIVRVADSSVSPYHGGPQRYEKELVIEVIEATGAAPPLPPPSPEVQARSHDATVRIPTRAGGKLTLTCGRDPDLDADPRRRRVDVARGADAVFLLDGLTPDTAYFCRVDGLGAPVRFPLRTAR